MAVTRAATTLLEEELKDLLEADDILGTFNIYDLGDLQDEKYPPLPFIAIRVMRRTPTEFFTRSIRGATVDVMMAITFHDTHPNDASLSGIEYAEWLAEYTTNFLNTTSFDDLFVIDRDVSSDVTDSAPEDDVMYLIMFSMDMSYETEEL